MQHIEKGNFNSNMYLESNVVKSNSVHDVQHDDDVVFFYYEKKEYKMSCQGEGREVKGGEEERKGPGVGSVWK